ncbi:methyltransferase domain-containing protein [Segetibacter sp.]|uniref:class I SAM-dependent methyltransferase n=1 Tax=Segetibacter sp. TaxID=2231182 RepID=UPI00260644FC|nr:methyltransferase domain-containing protein [Segetibacter sp.]MCW3081462.1 methyltransferase [Segetibacter sp.]
MMDVLGKAISDFYTRQPYNKLWIHNKYGKKEEMPIATYFRNVADMPDLELIALQNCTGKILDIGAGAGSHALELQDKGFDVTALEISEKAAEVLRLRGVKKINCTDIFSFDGERFDTLLLLMNGIGLTGNIAGLKSFLQHAKKLIDPLGQLIFDSSDVAYLYDHDIPEMDHYYGEIRYRYEYKKQKTEWFTWLYIDQKMLTKTAEEEGWKTEIIFQDEFDQYLAKLVLKA